MGWLIAEGIDGDGARLIVSIDGKYRDPEARLGRDTVVVVRVSDPRILEFDERIAFEESLSVALARFGGVYASSYARLHPHASYTWIYYASQDVVPGEVSIPGEFASTCHVAVARDPNWTEYESFCRPRPKLFKRVVSWLKQMLPVRHVAPQIIKGDQADADVAVLNAMARAGCNLSKETDVVFYLYFADRETAAGCARELWDEHFRAAVLMPAPADQETGGEWVVRARQDMVPTLLAIRSAGEVMEAMASRYTGTYDGWEAAERR
jgi:hypothetical protein